jgi:membrane dipeptidase
VRPLLWDQHICLPLRTDANVDPLVRYQRDGGAVVSVNAGYAERSFSETKALLEHYRAAIVAHEQLDVVAAFDDVDAIVTTDRIAVVFDLEGCEALDDCLDNMSVLAGLGVRTILLTYNRRNRAGSGCLDTIDDGLTAWGRSVVGEMNRCGIAPDGSHCGARTGLDMCKISAAPVIYSHSCMRAVWDHPRNITDDQAKSCADTGGVIGITGLGILLGANTAHLDAMTRHLEYAVDLVGIDHVGISSDFSFNAAEVNAELIRNPGLFDESFTRWGPVQWIAPETLLTLDEHLRRRSWNSADIDAVMGRNFHRVAQRVWHS